MQGLVPLLHMILCKPQVFGRSQMNEMVFHSIHSIQNNFKDKYVYYKR